VSNQQLSPRESEIVDLAVQGLTNEAIAVKLKLSIGTVNTYWLRIRLKVGGMGRTDTVVRVIKERAENALKKANVDKQMLSDLVKDKEHSILEMRASLALLQLAMDQIKSTVWATDKDLKINILVNGVLPSSHGGVRWETGKTIYQIFKSKDPKYPPIKAHLQALKGKSASLRLEDEFSSMVLQAVPLRGESEEIIGCIGIMNYVGE
jgi:DNA-binding CsgD family transcriptional regulator